MALKELIKHYHGYVVVGGLFIKQQKIGPSGVDLKVPGGICSKSRGKGRLLCPDELMIPNQNNFFL